jgi:hypothetical protein
MGATIDGGAYTRHNFLHLPEQRWVFFGRRQQHTLVWIDPVVGIEREEYYRLLDRYGLRR